MPTLLKAVLLLTGSILAVGCLGFTLHHPVPPMPPPPDYAPLAVVRIDPVHEWTETMVTVRKGERLIIRATGEIRSVTTGRHTNPDGEDWSSFGVGSGGLIGRIDDSKAFGIGARTHLFPDMHARPPHIPFVPPPQRMKGDGRLFLGFKRWRPGKFDGAFTVTIWHQP